MPGTQEPDGTLLPGGNSTHKPQGQSSGDYTIGDLFSLLFVKCDLNLKRDKRANIKRGQKKGKTFKGERRQRERKSDVRKMGLEEALGCVRMLAS